MPQNKPNRKKGMTLVEILVAVSLFGTVGLMALTIFVNITRIQGRLALENAIYEDARFMMERISRAIRNNSIDYEEYFNKGVSSANQFGELYGCYAAQFYNPGQGTYGAPGNLTDIPGTLGAQCNDTSLYTGQDCVVFKPSIDLNTGTYPYKGAIPAPIGSESNSNAFCPLYLNGALGCTPAVANSRSQLYLIDKGGKVKTIFARKVVNTLPDASKEYALSMFEILGEDSNNDDLTETWLSCAGGNTLCCPSDYDCASLTTLEESLTNGNVYKGFVPISPLRTNMTRLEFEIMPSEDPRKAFAEPASIAQPRVRITLAVQPSADQLSRYGNPAKEEIPTIVLQNTVSSRIQSEVKSYMGPGTYSLTSCNLTN